MKQLFIFFGLSGLVIAVMTIAAVAIAFREIQTGDFLERLSVEVEDEALEEAPNLDRPEKMQLGLNFIRFFWTNGQPVTGRSVTRVEPWSKPVVIFDDFEEIGVQGYRQFIKADLLWNVVEPQDDQWNFEEADEVIPNADFEPIVTLFALQYASATPPWATSPDEFQYELGPEAKDYLATVVDRYGPYVTYWELGNEMDHWRAADPGAGEDLATQGLQANLPAYAPEAGFTPEQQGAFLAAAAEFIRERDDDAVIVMPGMGGLDAYTTDVWFSGVLTAGDDWFDVVNYHFYNEWNAYLPLRSQLDTFLAARGIADKPVWMTETGSSSDETLTIRTNYLNTRTTQAADVWRRIIQAYGAGDAFVAWHTYIGSPEIPENTWRSYGLRTSTGAAQESLDAFALLASEVIPFDRVERVGDISDLSYQYRVVKDDGSVVYAVWGEGEYLVPEGMHTAHATVHYPAGVFGDISYVPGDVVGIISPGTTIPLRSEPVLLKGLE